MKRIYTYLALALLTASCARTDRSEPDAPNQIIIAASFSNEQPKESASANTKATAAAFEAGDELGLFVVRSGQEIQSTNNLVNNAKLVVASDGSIKGTPDPIYYPTKTTTSLYSYYPYQSGHASADALGVHVGIRTDQTDLSAHKLSDLCFGSKLNTTATNTAQAITFTHRFAQLTLNITAFDEIKAVRLFNIKDSARLNIQTGAVTLRDHTAEIVPHKNTSTSYTAIIPAQTLTGACIAIDLKDGKTYTYNAVNPIALTQSATNTLNLTINEKGIITLNGTAEITAWTSNTNSGTISESINNQITLMWLAPHAQFASADKVVLTIVDLFNNKREVEAVPVIDPKSTAEYAVYTFAIRVADLGYPSIISTIKIYAGAILLREAPQATIISSTLYKSGAHSVGIRINCIKINNLWWATGNLVANGANDCKIGAPGDGGLYFQYGGLIGYKGGANGDGTGVISAAKYPTNGVWWNGASSYSANDIAVTPIGYTSSTTTWPLFENKASGGFGYYYYNSFVTKYADFQSQANANNVAQGIGDPCAHYLGSPWRLPTYVELSAIAGNVSDGVWVPWTDGSITGKWTSSGPQSSKGAWFGPNSRTGTPTTATDLFIPASGCRNYNNGVFLYVGVYGFTWSSSAYNYPSGLFFKIHESLGAVPRNWDYRAFALSVRCVQSVPIANAVEINSLWWSTMNVGATTSLDYGNKYTFAQALTACPSGWRLPTREEFKALFSNVGNNTVWANCPAGNWTTLSGVNGAWAGPGAKTVDATTAIFFPAAGESGGNVGSRGYYWSSSPYDVFGYNLLFSSSNVNPEYYDLKTYSFSVRCVK